MARWPIPALLRERASLQPDRTAFTFIDYEKDWAGVSESVTWSRLHRRVVNIAQELRLHGSPGDRAVILAPQGLDYIAAFLGALQSGLVAVPLGFGGEERINSVMHDATPSVVLTTSGVVDEIARYVESTSGEPPPSIIEVDLLDLDSKEAPPARTRLSPGTEYVQYTSGSPRHPPG